MTSDAPRRKQAKATTAQRQGGTVGKGNGWYKVHGGEWGEGGWRVTVALSGRQLSVATCPGPRSAYAVVGSAVGGGKLSLFGSESSSLNQTTFYHYGGFWCFNMSLHSYDLIETKMSDNHDLTGGSKAATEREGISNVNNSHCLPRLASHTSRLAYISSLSGVFPSMLVVSDTVTVIRRVTKVEGIEWGTIETLWIIGTPESNSQVYTASYLSLPYVRDTLSVDPSVPVNFSVCSPSVAHTFALSQDEFQPGTKEYVEALLQRGIKVVIDVGNLDWICNWVELGRLMGTFGKKAGLTRSDGRLTFVTVEGAGHMVLYDKPREAAVLVERWLKGEEI
ncbi:Alpha/Beta hydrolase protein [Cyathus striatus]|nr:Alpha/Beta hydrolase protein [Cyathus striatus]